MSEDDKKLEDSTTADVPSAADPDAADDAADDADADDADTSAETSGDAAAEASSATSAKPAAAEAADDEEEDDEEEDGEDEDEDEEPAAREPVAAAKGEPTTTPKPKPKPKATPARDPEPAHATSPRKRAPLPPDPPPAALGKTVTIFVLAMGGLSAGFYLLGTETGGGDKTAPRWKTGQTVDVNITLVANDKNELACASETVVADRRCEFVNKTKPADKVDDAKLLKPYTTTDNVQFLGAGLWSTPDLEVKKLPADRFTVKCKFTVEGEIKKPGIRWASRGGFSDKENTWYAGALKECALAP